MPNEQKSATSHFSPKNNTHIGTCTRSSLYVLRSLKNIVTGWVFFFGRKLLVCADGFQKLTSDEDKNYEGRFS